MIVNNFEQVNSSSVFTKKIGNQQKVNDASINTDPATTASTLDVKPPPSTGRNRLDFLYKVFCLEKYLCLFILLVSCVRIFRELVKCSCKSGIEAKGK